MSYFRLLQTVLCNVSSRLRTPVRTIVDPDWWTSRAVDVPAEAQSAVHVS
jgi:hypothetical protein